MKMKSDVKLEKHKQTNHVFSIEKVCKLHLDTILFKKTRIQGIELRNTQFMSNDT